MLRNSFHELSVQLNISTQCNVRDVSNKYRLSFSGSGWFLMWRNFGYTQSNTAVVCCLNTDKEIKNVIYYQKRQPNDKLAF